MITAEIRIMDDNGNIIGTYTQDPARVSYSGITTSYEFSFTFVTLDKDDKEVMPEWMRRIDNGKNSASNL